VFWWWIRASMEKGESPHIACNCSLKEEPGGKQYADVNHDIDRII
jgi:hypothetical protein